MKIARNSKKLTRGTKGKTHLSSVALGFSSPLRRKRGERRIQRIKESDIKGNCREEGRRNDGGGGHTK